MNHSIPLPTRRPFLSRWSTHPRHAARIAAAAWWLVAPALFAAAPAGGSLGRLPATALVDLEYYLEPVPGSPDAPRPLCLLLPGGSGDFRTAQGVLNSLGPAFLERGWAVAVPIAPEGRNFLGRNGRLVPKLVEELQDREDITEDLVVIAGVSNGGIAALEIAAEEPDLFSAVLVVPGIVSRDTRVDRLRDMPIYLRVGENDHLNWALALPDNIRRLRDAGAKVDAKVLAGQNHGIAIDWEELDRWLLQALGDNRPAGLRITGAAAPTIRIPPAQNRPVRTWTSRTGSVVEATLLQADGEAAVLRLRSGRIVRIAYNQLSDADQRHLGELSGMPAP
jgi:pimeloyl-ACP methyl ester carboxylesterase